MSDFLIFCRLSGGDAPSQLIPAAFYSDRLEFEALVGSALAAQGYRRAASRICCPQAVEARVIPQQAGSQWHSWCMRGVTSSLGQ